MRKPLIALVAVVSLAVVVPALIWLLVDVNQFRPAIQADLQKQLHRPVTLGAMSLGLLPLAVRVEDVSVGENPQFVTGRPFVTAKQIQVKAKLLSLLRKEIHVDSLVLTQPTFELVKNAAGQWNYADLTNASPSGNSRPVTLSLLQVDDGALAVSELGKPATRSLYEHVNLELVDYAPGKTYHLKAAAQLPGGKSDSFRFEGSGGPVGAREAGIQGQLLLTDAPLSGLARFAGATPPVDGQLSGTVDLTRAAAATTAAIKFELKNATADGKALGFPVSLNGNAKDDPLTGISRFTGALQVGKVPIAVSAESNTKTRTAGGSVRIREAGLAEVLGIARLFGAGSMNGTGIVTLELDARGPLAGSPAFSGSGVVRDAQLNIDGFNKPLRVANANLKFDRNSVVISQLSAGLASSNLKGTATVSNFTAPSVVFAVDVDKLDIDEMQRVSNAPTPATGPSAKAKPSNLITGRGNLHVGTLLSQGLVLTDVNSQCVVDKGIVTLAPLSAHLFGGTQTGSLRADTRRTPTAVDLNLKLISVDSNQLLSALTSVKNTLFGILGANGELHLALGTADVSRSLNGNLNLNLVKGRLAGTSILNELSTIGRFAGFDAGTQNFTAITQMGGDISIVNGLATTNNLQMVMDGGSLSAAGTVNLADQTVNLKMTAVLDRALSQRAGGTGVGGYLTTALSNGKGELVIPANVTGTFSKPRFAPDAARLAEMKLRNVLPALTGPGGILSNPKGAGRSILDALSGRHQAAEPAGPSKDPANKAPEPEQDLQKNGVQSIIDLFRKKK
jgi:AsmA protein